MAEFPASAFVCRAAGSLADDAGVRPVGVPFRIPFDQSANDPAGAAGAADCDAEIAVRAAPSGVEVGFDRMVSWTSNSRPAVFALKTRLF